MAYYVINGKKVPYFKYDINGIIKKLEENEVKIGSQMSKVLNSAVDNTKEHTKHILIERLVIKDGYEFNFIDLETKEFYWSYYTDNLNYNLAKTAFDRVLQFKNVKYYLEE
nr:MAG TPA: hypothetical protein [Caudoviricetes sp.]